MKNSVVINKEKGFTRIKVANFRKFNPKKGSTVSGYTLFAYVYSDRLRLVRLGWSTPISFGIKSTCYLTIKYNKGNFDYSIDGKPTSHMCLSKVFYAGKYQYKKTQLLRLQRIIKKWAESLGHTYKSLPNPTAIQILNRLFYPSLQRMDPKLSEGYSPSQFPKISSLMKLHLPLKEIIRRILGSCGRKTYKLVCEKLKEMRLDYVIDRLYLFKQVFGSIDDVQAALQAPLFDFVPVSDRYSYINNVKSSQIIQFLKSFTKARVLTTNNDELFLGPIGFMDTVRMWVQLDKPEIERGIGFKDYHDRIAIVQRKRVEADYDLNPSFDLLSIDGLEIDGLTVVVPKTRYELVEWGCLMENCIASYAENMRGGHTHLFGVKEGDKLVYNVMFSPKRSSISSSTPQAYDCNQFYGKHNSRVDPKIVKKIFDSLPIQILDSYYSNEDHYQEMEW